MASWIWVNVEKSNFFHQLTNTDSTPMVFAKIFSRKAKYSRFFGEISPCSLDLISLKNLQIRTKIIAFFHETFRLPETLVEGDR